jgi:FlaA1/EpsC-like NDP-sugar epimerase
MGEPIRILDIAEQIIRFSGFEPGKEIGIKFIGMRPGERLEEPLWSSDENPQKTDYPMILKLGSARKEHFNLEELLASVYPVCIYSREHEPSYRNRELLVRILCDAVPALKEFYGLSKQQEPS